MKEIMALSALIFCTILGFGQGFKYVINTEKLNIRESAGKQFNIVGQISKGDKVTALSENNGWTKITTENGINGYVNSRYLAENPVEKMPQEVEPKEKGFKYGFHKAFRKLFLVIFFILLGIEYYRSKRIKDGRYNKGYKDLRFTFFELVKFALYSSIICAIIGLFMGISYWIKSF